MDLAPPELPPVLFVLGNHGDERCGVGGGEPLVVAGRPGVVVVDPGQPSGRAFRRQVRAALPDASGAVVVYPTLDLVERLVLVPRLLWLRARLGRGRWLRVHLHEFAYLRRRHRAVVALLVGLVADRVVVSAQREVDAARRQYRGWLARRELVVHPPANAMAPTGPIALSDLPPDRRRVGVHGSLRPDKGIDWLFAVLRRLDHRYGELEVVGRDWDVEWPEDLRSRFSITQRGQVPKAELAAAFAGWHLAVAPFATPPYDGRCSLRTTLAHGVPTLTRGPRPADLQLAAPHLWFDDEVDVGHLPDLDPAARRAGAEAIAHLEARWRAELRSALFEP